MSLLKQFGPQDEEILKQMQMRQQPAPTMQAQPSYVAPQQQGFFQRLGAGIKNFTADDERMARLTMGLNSMRMQPDAGIAAMAQSRLENAQQQKLLKKQTNRTVELLNKMGRPDLASLVERQPELAKDVLKEAYGIGGASAKSYAPQLDPATGQYYIPQYDPQTNEATRINIEGAVGETPEEQAKRELDIKLLVADHQKAQEVGQNAMAQVNNIDKTIGTLNVAYNALLEGGKSGFVERYLPAFDNATATLRQAANMLGIDIINSATFGALSEAELKLALETGLPMQLSEEELKKHILRRIQAQTKLRNELFKQAQTLSAGNLKYSDYIKQYEPKGGTEILLDGGGLPDSATKTKPRLRYNPETNQFEEVGG